jgi:aminoglycoside phosphotransferase family enzyme
MFGAPAGNFDAVRPPPARWNQMTIRGETFLSHEPMIAVTAEPSLASKIAFLSRPDSYGDPARTVSRRETHMSWVFLAGDRVFKLKKPVRFPYLDFSTVARREAACRAELRLNRRLAADVYLSVVPLVWTPRGLAIGGSGVTVDWLVVMRRLDEALTLERMILDRCLTDRYLDRLLATLAAFYRHAGPVRITPARHFADWERNLNDNRRVLFEPRLALPLGLIRRIDSAQRRFLVGSQESFAARACGRYIVDGHGDLRPEHVWVDDPIRIIDCLEFNPKLRAVDPLDEVAFLSVECDHLGASWASNHLRRRSLRIWGDGATSSLFCFYRCYRATLRARLTIAHLLEPNPRTPEKWLPLARDYLRIATADAVHLERMLRTRADR